MAIIKSYNATTILKEAIVLDLGDVARQAQHLRESAQAKARSIIEEAENQVETLRQTAHNESAAQGHQEGFEKGLEEGRQQGFEEGHQEAAAAASGELERIQQAWIDAMSQWEAHRQEIQREVQRTIVAFAVHFAQKVVHRTVEVDPEVVLDQLADVLSHVLRAVDVTVRICGEDQAVLERSMPRLLSEFTNVKHIHLVQDEGVSRGGCIVSYGQGQIDASIETQLKGLTELII